MTYNGYKNYETWNVCSWISKDETLYNLSKTCANYVDFVDCLREENYLETPDNVAWMDSRLDIDAINEACFPEDANDDEVDEWDDEPPDINDMEGWATICWD